MKMRCQDVYKYREFIYFVQLTSFQKATQARKKKDPREGRKKITKNILRDEIEMKKQEKKKKNHIKTYIYNAVDKNAFPS